MIFQKKKKKKKLPEKSQIQDLTWSFTFLIKKADLSMKYSMYISLKQDPAVKIGYICGYESLMNE